MKGKKGLGKCLIVLLSVLVIVTVGLWVVAGTAEAKSAYKEYAFGIALPLSGPFGEYGKPQSECVLMGVEDVNKMGGVNGVPLKAIVEDTKSNPKDGVTAMIKLVDMYKVPFVVTTTSSITKAQQPIAVDRKVVLTNLGAWGPDMANRPNLYSSCVIAPYVLKAASWDLFNKLGVRKAAYIATNDPAGVDVVEVVAPIWEKWGGKVVAKEYFQGGASDFTPQLTRIKAANPDVILTPIHGTAVGFFVKQVRDMGIKVPVMTTYFSAANYKVAGESSDGLLICCEYLDKNNPSPITQDWYPRATKMFGREPYYHEANGYDLSRFVLVEAIKESEKMGGDFYTGENLKNAIVKIRTFDSVFGSKLIIGEDQTAIKPIAIFEMKGGSKKLLRLAPPPEK
ncbi:MAG: ABC transporter substrate-binding protein [Pseudomonadota bacterium]